MSSYVVTPCRESDLAELFPLFRRWYSFNPRLVEKDFFDWQFRDTPQRLCDGEYDFLVLRDRNDRIAGCLGFVGFKFHHAGRIGVGGWTHNWQADGEGGLALLGRFMELVDNRFLLRLNDVSGGIAKLLRIPLLHQIPRLWAAIDPARVADLFGMMGNDLVVLQNSAELFRQGLSAPSARHVAQIDPEEEFHFAHLTEVDGAVCRTGRYLNWRYVEIPRHNYRIIRTERAFAVYRTETVMGTDAGVIRVLEWTFPREEAAGALGAILTDAKAQNPVLIDFHCTLEAIERILRPIGFVRQSVTTVAMPDLFRPTHRSGGYSAAIDLPPHRTQRSIDFNKWYITIGDSDIDRVKL